MHHPARSSERLQVVQRHLTAAVIGTGVFKPSKYSITEWTLRCKLAVAYRIAAHFGWDQIIFNHITVKIPGSEKAAGGPHFLINPLGLRFDEVTASSLLRVTIDGHVIDPGTGTGGLFRQGYVIHSAIHQARHDAQCVWHCHHYDTTSVAMSKDGILPLSQEAIGVIHDIAYHPFEGTANDESEGPRLQRSLGQHKHVLMLLNHGPCTVAKSIEDAFFLMFLVCRACTYQQKALSLVGGDLRRLHIPTKAQVQAMHERAKKASASVNSEGAGENPSSVMVFRAVARIIERRDGTEHIYC